MTWTEPEKESKPFINVPAGPHIATCIDVVDLGVPDWTVNKDNPMGTPKVRIVFHVRVMDDDGKPVNHPDGKAWICSQTFSAFFGPKAFLRKFVEAWVGPAPKNERGYAIFDEESLIGRDAYINVSHTQGKKDPTKTYANVESAAKPLPGMRGPGAIPDYVREKDRPARNQYQKPQPKPDGEGLGF